MRSNEKKHRIEQKAGEGPPKLASPLFCELTRGLSIVEMCTSRSRETARSPTNAFENCVPPTDFVDFTFDAEARGF